jgi:hypothetical protein
MVAAASTCVSTVEMERLGPEPSRSSLCVDSGRDVHQFRPRISRVDVNLEDSRVRGDEEPDQAGVNRWQVTLEDDGLAELGGSLLHDADQVDELLETLHRRQENKDLALPVLDAQGAPRHLLRLDFLGLSPSSRSLAAGQRRQLVERRNLGLLGWLGPPRERTEG